MKKSGKQSTKSAPSKGKTSHTPAANTSTGKSTSSMAKRKSRTSQGGSSRIFPRRNWNWRGISPERKLDFLGVALALVGLLSLLSLLSGKHGTLTSWWVTTLNHTAGWGMLLLPVSLIGFGLWLVFRNVERLPSLSLERIVGILLLFLLTLTILHILFGGGWDLAAEGSGGGYIGAALEQMLIPTIGLAGTIVVLVGWFLVGLAFTLDLSIPEMFQILGNFFDRMRGGISSRVHTSEKKSTQPSSNEALPPEFQPLSPWSPNQAASPPPPSKKAEATKSTAKPTPPPPGTTSVTSGKENAGSAVSGNIPPVPAQTWNLPSLEAILNPPTPQAVQAVSDQERAHLIEETLASFGAPCHVVEIHRGPTVTQFGVEPDFIENRSGRTRVRVSRITSLADDLALALAASRIRIQAPVPGRNYVGIEVPNAEISLVSLREVIESERFQKIKSHLRFALGKDVSGHPAAFDLTYMPHLLIAGTTGSGKSVAVNSILCCFLLNNTPDELKLILVDPKRVELTGYNGIPHLLAPVVVEAERVIGALQWMLREMDSRYHKFSRAGVRNIHEFNSRNPNEKLPFLVIVIDELADLMIQAPDETERSITRLAQLARATGIHLILATQRPSVDVITGLIKANFPARVAFAVASGIDSRVILDQPGAERLLGRGDMLFQAPDASAPVREQGVYVSDSEIQRLVDYWRQEGARHSQAYPTVQMDNGIDSLPTGVPLHQVPLWDDMESQEDQDPLLKEAIDLVRREGRASITMLQRRMRIGYTRAARMIETMEEKKIIGPTQPNTQVREVLDYGPTRPPVEE